MVGSTQAVLEIAESGVDPFKGGHGDGLWSGASDDQIATMAARVDEPIGDILSAISRKALTANAPYSDNTTGTAVRWLEQ